MVYWFVVEFCAYRKARKTFGERCDNTQTHYHRDNQHNACNINGTQHPSLYCDTDSSGPFLTLGKFEEDKRILVFPFVRLFLTIHPIFTFRFSLSLFVSIKVFGSPSIRDGIRCASKNLVESFRNL